MNKYNKKLIKTMIATSLGLALTACGGSSSSTTPDADPVPETNTAPTISSNAITMIESGMAYSYSLVGADADGDTLTMSAENLPAWLTFDSTTGILSGAPADTDAGDYAITLTVSDGVDQVTQSFTINVTVEVTSPNNTPAVITSSGITNATVGEAYSYTLTATDADSDTLTMSADIPSALSWLTFNTTTGNLSGTPASGDIASTAITITVNDGTEDTTQTFTISVTDTPVVILPVSDAPRNASEASFIVSDGLNNWEPWVDTNGSSQIITDADPLYDSVNEITITASQFVAGYRPTSDGTSIDMSAFASTGTLELDLKVTTIPMGTDEWFIKIEGDAGNQNDYSIFLDNGDHSAIELDVWKHYSFNLSDLSDLDLTAINNVMLFPAWPSNGGAVYQLDNVAFYPDGAKVNDTPDADDGDSGDGATTTTAVGIDFEGPLQLTWSAFNTAKVQYVDNPNTTGNASTTVALFDISQNDDEWIGARTEGIDTFALNASNCVVKIDVYSDTIGEMHVKFEKQNGDGFGSAGTVSKSNSVVNEWETLTFDTCGWIGNPETDVIDGFVIHPDRTSTRSSDTLVYIDNIMFSAQEVTVDPADPTVGAPVPTLPAADVISVFSNTYTAVGNVDTNPNWGQATVTTVIDITGNSAIKMQNLNYQGIAYDNQDVSGKTNLHLDYWTADSTGFDVFLISPGFETLFTVTPIQNGWQSIDIPLSTYSGVVDLTDVFQFKFDAQAHSGGTIYIDNLYFH